jgi:ribosomal protein L11
MKKRYGLESIIGKKSKLRFPTCVFIKTRGVLNLTILSNIEEVAPPLSTTLTLHQCNSYDLIDSFNENTNDFEEGLPLSVTLLLPEAIYEINSPTTSCLFELLLDLYDIENLKTNKFIIFLLIINLALIKLDPNDIFLFDLTSTIRSIYGNLNSYNCKRIRKKKYISLSPMRKRYYNISNNVLSRSTERDLKFFRHSLVLEHRKIKKYHRKKLLTLVNNFTFSLDDWDDLYDFFPDFLIYKSQLVSFLYSQFSYLSTVHSLHPSNKSFHTLLKEHIISSIFDISNNSIINPYDQRIPFIHFKDY